jgi:peptidoglycan hydrolase FlgJ
MDLVSLQQRAIPERQPSAPAGPKELSPDAAARVAREFEAVFLGTVMEEMLKTGQPTTFGGGHAEEMWRSLLARAYADQMVQTGGLGLAAGVEESLTGATAAYKKR